MMTTPVWHVTDVQANDDYTLRITFADGSIKQYDASLLLQKQIYEPLKNLSFFKRAHAEYGTVIWNDEIDIAPEHLYECGVPIR